jgi:predicted nucleotidyltransferase
VLFGSRSRGDDHADSDVDLLVSVREGERRRALASRLSEKLGLRVELVTLEDAQEAPLLFAEVVREGRVVVDREGLWPRVLRDRERVERAARRERHRIDAEFSAVFGRDAA